LVVPRLARSPSAQPVTVGWKVIQVESVVVAHVAVRSPTQDAVLLDDRRSQTRPGTPRLGAGGGQHGEDLAVMQEGAGLMLYFE
jgi:hypothetical protein